MTLSFIFCLLLNELMVRISTHSFPMHPFSNPRCFQIVEKACIGNEWVKLKATNGQSSPRLEPTLQLKKTNLFLRLSLGGKNTSQ